MYVIYYRGADKSLARPWKETSYSDQDLQHYTKTYGVQTTGIYSCCMKSEISESHFTPKH